MSTEDTKKAATEQLWRIAETDRIDQVDALLETGADVNASNEHGMTALMRATANGRVRMVSVLLARGADPNALRNDKFTPLLLASFFGHDEIVKILVAHGADIDATSRSETSAQMWATCRNFLDVVDYLEQPRCANENTELPVHDDGPSVTPIPSEIPAAVKQTESGKPWYLESPKAARRLTRSERLKWGLVGFAGALAFVLVSMITDRAMLREDSLTPPPMPKQSTEVRIDSTGWTDSPSENLVTPGDTKTEKVTVAPKENVPEAKQNQLQTRPSTRTEPSSAESRAPETPVKESEGIKVSLPERSSETARSTSTEPATPPQPAPSREQSATKPPAPVVNQLLTGSKSSAPTGKVIRWP